jgi:hypothetical protein
VGKNYYYLVSSLRELVLDATTTTTYDDFLNICNEEMSAHDFDELRKTFVFNDIRNAVSQQTGDESFISPSYYDRETFVENLTDTDAFFPFMADWFYNRSQERRVYPDLQDIDELVTMFYENLDDFGGEFIRDYFSFELDLQNVTTALSLRAGNNPPGNFIIPVGESAASILKSTSPDFGLSVSLPWLESLLDLFESEKTEEIELEIEQIRWDWLDDRISLYTFSAEVVFAYAVKLQSVMRWMDLDPEKGMQVLQTLLTSIENDIQFPEEFSVIGRNK